MGALLRGGDWSTSRLGPVDAWPQSLRTAVDLILGSPNPMCVLWGNDLVQIYNDGFAAMAGTKHPDILGCPAHECWPDLFALIVPIYEAVRQGEARSRKSQALVVERQGGPEEAWFDLTYSPLRNEAGVVAGILVTAFETTAEQQAIRARKGAEDQLETVRGSYRLAIRAGHLGTFVWHVPTDRFVANATFCELFNLDPEQMERGVPLSVVTAAIHPADWSSVNAAIQEAMRTGDDYEVEYRVFGRGGEQRWVLVRGACELDANGRPRRFPGAVADITDRKRAEADLRARVVAEKTRHIDAERRHLRRLFAQAPGFIAILDGPQHVIELVNDAYYQAVGRRDIIGKPVREALPEIEGQGYLELLDRVYASGEPFVGHGIRVLLQRQPGGPPAEVYQDIVYQPIVGPDGRVSGIFVQGHDVTARKAAESSQHLLMREVDHRAKNALAVVQAVVRLTRADTVDGFIEAVERRVSALARTHQLLARHRWTGLALREVIREELAPYLGAEAGGRLRMAGPELTVAADAVQAVGMVLHELATNASKYGALSHPQGRVEVSWSRSGDGAARIDWREIDGPPVTPPRRTGFGSRLITATAAGQLGGSATFAWEPAGLRFTVVVAADRLAHGEAASGPRPATAAPAPATGLDGSQVLVVEDDAVLAMVTQDALEALGCKVVGPATTVDEALRLVAAEPDLDFAILDVNVQGRQSFPIADILSRRRVPFLFATGYGKDIATGQAVPVLEKPFTPRQLEQAARALLLKS
ncbi:hypothetical protein [Azospirillum endophyticum]